MYRAPAEHSNQAGEYSAQAGCSGSDAPSGQAKRMSVHQWALYGAAKQHTRIWDCQGNNMSPRQRGRCYNGGQMPETFESLARSTAQAVEISQADWSIMMTQQVASETTYAVYWLFKTDPAFLRLEEEQQRASKAEFLAAIEGREPSVKLRGMYSTIGFRPDVDLMMWVYGVDLDAIQRLAVSLRKSGLGKYLITREAYVGVVAGGRYDPAHSPAFMQGAAPKKYISVYPFVKTAEWYLLPYERRRDLMAEHGIVGRKYAVPRDKIAPENELAGAGRGTTAVAEAPAKTETDEEGGGVLANTVDSFGLGDYEFILANESDDPAEISRMMETLRATEVRRYTKLDVPIFLGRLGEPAEVLADL